MWCGRKKKDANDGRVPYRIKLWRKALLYDIGNYAYVEAEVLPVDAENTRHQLADIVEDGNVDRVTRMLGLVYRECVEMLYPYCKRPLVVEKDGCVLDDKLEEEAYYVVDLSLPHGFSETTVEYLKDLIHEYIVCRVLADWISMVRAGSESNWLAKAEELRSKMRSALMSRRSMQRRPLKPF